MFCRNFLFLFIYLVAVNYRCSAEPIFHEDAKSYEFVAYKLGIVSETVSWKARLGLAMQDYAFPTACITAAGSAPFIMDLLAEDMNVIRACKTFGVVLVPYTVYSVLLWGGRFYENKARTAPLRDFVKNWPEYQDRVPKDLHPLFNALYDMYIYNGEVLNVSEMLTDNVTRFVLGGMLCKLTPKKL